jgi:hypothetical protein
LTLAVDDRDEDDVRCCRELLIAALAVKKDEIWFHA